MVALNGARPACDLQNGPRRIDHQLGSEKINPPHTPQSGKNQQPGPCHSLRPHQTSLIGKIDRSLEDGIGHIVVQAATGFGKTIVGATLAKRNLQERRRTLFIVPALSLIDQTVEKFYAEGIRDIGVIQANHDLTNWSRSVQIASVQTLMRRQIRRTQGD